LSGLVAGIHVFNEARGGKDVNGWAKPGHRASIAGLLGLSASVLHRDKR
jgi:hypothetical protein